MSNFASLPRRDQILGQIDEAEEDTFDAENKEKDNYISANVRKSASPMAINNEDKAIDSLS